MQEYEIITKSSKETKKVAALLAKEVRHTKHKKAFVIALEGELGAGKTTFTQGFARALGVKENVLSPTFVLLKVYPINTKRYTLKHLVHIDCYRLDSPKELLHLGFKGLFKDKDAIILVEWANKIKKILPWNALWIRFKHGRKSNERIINVTT